jgi:uncharacterized protein YjbI with pentapeptide repeats
MIVPKRAPVKPRVISPHTGETVSLEDEIRPWIEAHATGRIAVTGPPGSGKTTALEHLAAVLPSDFSGSLCDDAADSPASLLAGTGLVIYAAATPSKGDHVARLSLAPWKLDDAIEYLLATHKPETASVIQRLRAAGDLNWLNGTPELWRIVLDQMAADEKVLDISGALHRYFDCRGLEARVHQLVRTICLTVMVDKTKQIDRAQLGYAGCPEDLLNVIRHGAVQAILAAEQVAADLHAREPCDYFRQRLPAHLVSMVADLVSADPAGVEHLHRLLADFPWKQAMAASILHATGTGWRPEPGRVPLLANAILTGVAWPGFNFEGVSLMGADLNGANIHGAELDRVVAVEANFVHATLQGASLNNFWASEADLAHANFAGAHGEKVRLDSANLQGANLEGAILNSSELQGANLTMANFREANLFNSSIMAKHLEGADFTNANLEQTNLSGVKLRDATFVGARFVGANLSNADLEGMDLPSANFANANLDGALLTDTAMPGANFCRASLRHAGLADVNWEDADLKFADLTGATFHMGSSRSGRVDSFIASEGTRTGFYTDDYEEQTFKAPEEIRKANLCGADLRGARIDDVDFYLVDVRGALYDPDQEKHLRRCRAILENRS